MKLVFGKNRRQKPLELLCPHGKITVTREAFGAIRVRVVADDSTVEVWRHENGRSADVVIVREEEES